MTEPVRCAWVSDDELYRKYHDEEWGVPVFDDKKLFEFLLLESFQAGLSWLTILKKRENFRKAFDDFDYEKIAHYDSVKLSQLINNKGIIRNSLKIKAAVNNAGRFMEIQDEYGSFSTFLWSFVKNKPIINHFTAAEQVPAHTPLSDKISKELKNRGFKFTGSTIVYSFMQATGIVMDHTTNCFRYKELKNKT